MTRKLLALLPVCICAFLALGGVFYVEGTPPASVQLQGTITTNLGFAATSPATITAPSSIQAGEYILVFLGDDTNVTNWGVCTATGMTFTELGEQAGSTSTSIQISDAMDGDESGNTISCTFSGTRTWFAEAMRVSGYVDATTPVFNSRSANVDPSAVTVVGNGISIFTYSKPVGATYVCSACPSGWTKIASPNSADETAGVGGVLCSKSGATGSQDPGQCTQSGTGATMSGHVGLCTGTC